MSHKDSSRLQRQNKKKLSPRTSPLRVGFPHGRTLQLDQKQPSHPSKRPTGEASKPGPLKAPFQPLTQNKPTPYFSNRSEEQCLPGLNPFRRKCKRRRDIDSSSPSRSTLM